MQLKINNQTYELVSSTGATEFLKGYNRDVITLTVEMTYQQAVLAFVDNAEFTIVDTVDDVTTEFEYKDHGVSGPITDNRDGTVTAKMGKNNTSEQDALEAKQEAEAETAKVSQALVTLAGKPIQESDVPALRASFEQAANKLYDDDAKIAPSLTRVWMLNEAVTTGQRRYYAPDGNLYKALQDHTTSISTSPDTATDYWVKL